MLSILSIMAKYKSSLLLIGALGVFFVIAACSSNPEKITNTPEWSNRMQGFADNLFFLFPMVSDSKTFKNPDNYEHIDGALASLALMAHDMSKDISKENIKAAQIDPAVVVLAGTFKKELNTAIDAFRKGDYEYARSSTRGALQLCIQCHSRKSNDQHRAAVLDPKRLALMKPLYRADWLAVARHFDESLAVYKDVIQDESLAHNHSYEWQEAAQRAVAISVRAKGDPDQTEKIVDSILKSTQAPHYFLEKVKLWKDQIREWKSDKGRIKLNSNDYEKAKFLMQTAYRDNTLPYENYGNSYIYFLRASAYLHSYLGTVDDPTLSAKAYLLLGKCYDVLKDPGEVGLAKNYYKSCILTAPHTKIALECYDRYEEATYIDAIGGAVELPLSTVDYLDYLKGMATP